MFFRKRAARLKAQEQELADISGDLRALIAQGKQIMSDLTALQAALAANTTEVQAVAAEIATLNATDASLLAQLQAAQAGNDQPAIDTITAQLVSNNAAMAAVLPAPALAPAAAAAPAADPAPAADAGTTS
jgi:chromosome segregation ATPase